MTKRTELLFLSCLALAGACGDGAAVADGGLDSSLDGSLADAGSVVACAAHADCDDATFCNGVERCAPGEPGAGPDGCLSGPPPCDTALETCDEGGAMCRPDDCADGGDADGDGDARLACGGGDCDDGDDRVYGTAQEVCDADGLDEDCDPTTIHDDTPGAGDGDRDGDGFVDIACFNPGDDGGENRGDDCDDARPTIHVDGVEACDGRDNDCDARTDEGVLETYYRDVDGDNFGDPSMVMMDCTAPSGWVLREGDCDDRDGSVHPGAAETCNARDDDCSGTVDDPPSGCACTDGAERGCGPLARFDGVGICRRSTQRCVAGSWPSECPGAVYPRTEACNATDDDCDGADDEDFDCVRGSTAMGTTACGNAGSRMCTTSCTWATPAFQVAESAATCDYCDDTGLGIGQEIPFATTTAVQDVTDAWRLYGNARHVSGTWILADGSNQNGAGYLPMVVPIGHGDVQIAANVRTTAHASEGCSGAPFFACSGLGGAWAVTVLRESSTQFVAAGTYAPLPTSSTGIAAVWEFSETYVVDGLPWVRPADIVRLYRLPGGGVPTEVASAAPPTTSQQTGPAGQVVSQFLWLRLVPDDPATSAVDESSVEVSSTGLSVTCSNASSTPCGFSFRPGDSVHVGVLANTDGLNEVSTDRPALRSQSNQVCPP